MPHYSIPTSQGPVVFATPALWPDPVIVHGFQRTVGHLSHWHELLPGSGVLRLPGHGTPALAEVSVSAWTEAWNEALAHWPSPPTVIGESLGALVALGLRARAVVAIEPLLSVDQLWPQQALLRDARADGVEIGPAEEALFKTPYDWVLDRISAPTLVIAGADPLLPERPVTRAPSLLTDADLARYAAHPGVEAHRIAGGHALMSENPDGVLALVRPFLQRVSRAGP